MSTSPDTKKVVRQLIVIGLGLIGGSLAKAAKQRGVCEKVIGIARRDDVCQQALDLGVVDFATTDLTELVPSMAAGDVIFIAVPTLSVRRILEQVRDCVPADVTVTDGASVKGSVLRDVQEVYGCVPPQIVLGHPIAGSEKSGVEAANPDLYIKHRIILTPTPETDHHHLSRVTQLWQAVEAEVLHLGVEDHDEILGATSHLPHAIAFSLVDTLANDSKNENIFRYAAGGFRDFTRIASSDAVMWRDIMLANDKAVIQAIDLFSNNLNRLRSAIQTQNSQELLGIFTRAKAARDHFSAMLARRAYMRQDSLPNTDFRVEPSSAIQGEIYLPGDKSISHRAVMLGAIAEGVTEIDGFMEGEDAFASIQAFRDMGVVIEGPDDGRVLINGVGLRGLKAPIGPIYVGGAGTTMRLLCGLLAGQSFDSEVTTDNSLGDTSLRRVIEPLSLMGAGFAVGDQHRPPVFIHGGRPLESIEYEMPSASAQVKSSILFAGLYAQGETKVREPNQTRDHTERLIEQFGCTITTEKGWIRLPGGQQPKACHIDIPGDFSSAVVLIAAAGLSQRADLILKRVGLNPTRTAALAVLRGFGFNIAVNPVLADSLEPVGDICVTTSQQLVAQVITAEQVALMVDELPVLILIAAVAVGYSEFAGLDLLNSLQRKRIAHFLQELSVLGVQWQRRDGNLLVMGGNLSAGDVSAHSDHRLGLALALAGVRASGPVVVRNCATVNAAFPHFEHLAKRAGIRIETIGH